MINIQEISVASELLKETEQKLAKLIGVRVKLSFEVMQDLQITPNDVVECVSGVAHIPVCEIMGSSRVQRIVYARHIAIYMMRHRLGMSWKGIGRAMNRNHATAINSVRVVQNELEYNEELTDLFKKCNKAYTKMTNI